MQAAIRLYFDIFVDVSDFYIQVLAAVFGPKAVEARSQTDASKAIVRCEYAMAAFSTGERRRRGKMDRRSTELSMVIKNALEQTILLELLPKTQIDIYVQVGFFLADTLYKKYITSHSPKSIKLMTFEHVYINKFTGYTS